MFGSTLELYFLAVMYMPVKVRTAPNTVSGVGYSLSMAPANAAAPTGSPRSETATTDAGTNRRAQLYRVCPKIVGTIARARKIQYSRS